MIEQFHTLDSFTVDGRVYGLPFRGYTNQLFYNKELVESLGGIPETLEELIDKMVEADQAGYTPLVFDFAEDGFGGVYTYEAETMFEGILQRTIDEEKLSALLNGEAMWTDDEFVQAFEIMEELTQIDIPLIETAMPGDPLELAEAFLSEHEDIVFFYTGAYLPSIQASDQFAHSQGNIGVMAMPPMAGSPDDGYAVHGTFNEGFAFSGNITEQEEQMIYQFIEALWSDEYMIEYNIAFGWSPPINVESVTNDDLFMEVVQVNNQATGFFPELRSKISFLYLDEISAVINKLINDEISAIEAAEQLQEYHEQRLMQGEL